MRILISGAAGFLGSHLTDLLLSQGHEVVGVDNFITGKRQNIAHLAGNRAYSFVQHDVIEPLDLPGPLDRIYHMASPASPIGYVKHQVATMKVNSQGTWNLLELAVRKEARFLMASTSECYGDPAVHPQREDYWGNVNPIGPRGVYDEAKRFAEAMTMAYHRYHGVDVGIVRIFNTYGPSMRVDDGRAVSNFMVQALRGEPLTVYGDGSQTRSFCYVDDEVRGILALLDSGETGPINIGNPDEYTVLQLAEQVLEVTGSSAGVRFEPLPTDDPARRRPDIAKARNLLGWEPEVPLPEGLANTAAYFKAALV